MMIEKAKELIQTARRVAVLTGAGISTDSGLPDFRGPDGIWTKDPEAEKLSTIAHYMANPEVRKASWDKYVWNNNWDEVDTNEGHKALYRLWSQGKLIHIATQNIDGLHHKSGVPADRISELHGTLRHVVCMDCGERLPSDAVRDMGLEFPSCPFDGCSGYLKPDVVYFGQNLPNVPWDKSESAAISCDVYIAIGTSLQVWPAANLPKMAVKNGSAKLVIINRDPTDLDYLASAVIHDSISDTLKEIIPEIDITDI